MFDVFQSKKFTVSGIHTPSTTYVILMQIELDLRQSSAQHSVSAMTSNMS